MVSIPRFVVSDSSSGNFPPGTFVLVIDRWDDFHFKTQFSLYYASHDDLVRIGSVKVGEEGMEEYAPHTKLPPRFPALDDRFFSLGQDREYYEALKALPDDLGDRALRSLRDVAADPELFARVENEPVFVTSLMREVTHRTVTTQFRRITEGHAALTPYRFSYEEQSPTGAGGGLRLEFGVHPGDNPPTNVHVLIGPNGVGKSTLLREFVRSVRDPTAAGSGFRDEMDPTSSFPQFANLVHVSFSAFDPVQSDPTPRTSIVPVHLVGLQAREELDHHDSLVEQFLESIRICSKAPRRERWRAAMSLLSASDRLLADQEIGGWLPGRVEVISTSTLRERFSRLSSGHKIVVLTITRLVELVEEQSLVLLDEPETHLHPPLLSALTRAISDLVVDRNGVAIIATHSPVVLQEIPRSCVSVLQRSGEEVIADRPEAETFGESVSRLTSEVFRLDVLQTGYLAVLRQLLSENGDSAARVLSKVDLGSEGAFVLRALENEADRDA